MRSLVLLSTLFSSSSVPWAYPLASLSLNFLVCKMELLLSVLTKRNCKENSGTYLEPSVGKIQFVSLNLT